MAFLGDFQYITGETRGLKIREIGETSFKDDPLGKYLLKMMKLKSKEFSSQGCYTGGHNVVDT